MNFELTQEQRSMVNTVRELTQEKFRPNALKYMDGTFPWDNIRDLAKIGVLGMAVPEEYGGLGLPVLDTALVIEEIAKACYVTALEHLVRARYQHLLKHPTSVVERPGRAIRVTQQEPL